MFACVHAKLFQSCPTLWDPLDCSLPGSSLHGVLQTKILGGLPCPPPGDLPDPGIEPESLMSPVLAGAFFTISATREAYAELCKKVLCYFDSCERFCCSASSPSSGVVRVRILTIQIVV